CATGYSGRWNAYYFDSW
nr:immunoglobulin heavy chain junction region [Macaca mulatta]MOV53476.1 immunoglobulin heavy chain junction region [Macaca mulatta]MOV54244.1 immunoglobulin heavy chain junction region [Macaca mulatta]MOV54515.1 immunoglobulin heavy chain junction region [Macaca mulatta]MOV54569.1 immunoglobulin heavy chain junction region [Macaca mulatta]